MRWQRRAPSVRLAFRAHSGVPGGTPPARGARAGGTGTARGLGEIVRCDGICDG